MSDRFSGGLTGTVAVLALAFAGTASAVPCGGALHGGILPSLSCQDGPDGDSSPSAGDLNAGNFFGISNWSLLDSTADGVDSNYWSFWPDSSPNGTNLGLFGLADGIWDSFSSLTVVLNGKGGVLGSDTKWSAYLLKPDWDDYGWAYDYLHQLKDASLFGAVRNGTGPVAVPEPATAAILLLGLGGMILVLRRRATARL